MYSYQFFSPNFHICDHLYGLDHVFELLEFILCVDFLDLLKHLWTFVHRNFTIFHPRFLIVGPLPLQYGQHFSYNDWRKNVAFHIEAYYYYPCRANTPAFCRCEVVEMLNDLLELQFSRYFLLCSFG